MSWPLTGRSDEMRRLEAAISGSDVSGIVVSGPAGVGKSRIARAAVSAVQPRGYQSHWAVGTSSALPIPLGAFTPWTPTAAAGTVQLLRGVIETLTAGPPGVTTVVGVDDAHLLDDLSAFVVHQIVAQGTAKVVLTVRDNEPVPAAVQEVWHAGNFERLELRPLSLQQVTTLLAAALGGPVDHRSAQRLWNLTGGNALYLRNIVEQEVADGRLAQQQGYWRWTGDPIIPPSLIELIESRMGAQPAAVSDVIDTLAIAEPIGLTTLRRIADPAAVEEAEARGLITIEAAADGVQVRVAHPLYGEIRRRRAPAVRLRRLRGLVAGQLALSEDRDEVAALVRRAALSVDSDLEPDVDLLVRAARGAVWLADLPLAERLAGAALNAGAGADAGFLRAHALSWLSRGDDADAVLAGIDPARLSDEERARLAFLRASNQLWVLGDPARAKALVEDAALGAQPRARSYVDAFLTVYWFAMDQPVNAMQASNALNLADMPAVVGTESAWALTVMLADAGRCTEALSVAELGYDAATRALDAPHMRFNIADAHVGTLLLAGRIPDAAELAARVRREASDLPGTAQSLGAAVAGRAALGAGHLDDAIGLLEQATAALSAAGHAVGWGYRYRIPLATALAMRGSLDEAASVLADLDTITRRFRALDYEMSVARAWVAAGQGAVSEGVAILLAAGERAAANGQFAAEVLCLQTATQFGHRSAGARLGELESLVEGPRVGIAARFALAAQHGDPAALASSSLEFEQAGDVIAAIDAAAQAALVYRVQNLRGSALGCSTRADGLATLCGAQTPTLRQASEPVPLTGREREIVMLIGAGLSNKAVAERLTLSVRTVESHIYRAMARTGTTSREELATLLSPQRS